MRICQKERFPWSFVSTLWGWLINASLIYDVIGLDTVFSLIYDVIGLDTGFSYVCCHAII